MHVKNKCILKINHPRILLAHLLERHGVFFFFSFPSMFPHFLVILGSIASRLFECKAKDPRDSTNKFFFKGIHGSQKEIALPWRFPEMRFFKTKVFESVACDYKSHSGVGLSWTLRKGLIPSHLLLPDFCNPEINTPLSLSFKMVDCMSMFFWFMPINCAWRSFSAVTLNALSSWFHRSRGERIEELWKDYLYAVCRGTYRENIRH